MKNVIQVMEKVNLEFAIGGVELTGKRMGIGIHGRDKRVATVSEAK